MRKPNATPAGTQHLNQQAHQLNEGHRRLLSLASQQQAGNILETAESIIYAHIPGDNPTLGLLKEALELQSEQAAKGYTIALFGRTGVGKSTLAAILTNSDEPVIGEGAQRTTRETQEYRWDNLVVLDTPGIGAADRVGKADEEKALAAAEQADLVIFIATDDAPQDTEARFLAELDHRGKALIALMNCKRTINTVDDIEEFLFHPEDIFNEEDKQKRQTNFAEMAAKHTNRPTPEFHLTHLQAALIAQYTKGSDTASRLVETSRLNPILEAIKTAAAIRAKTSALKTPLDLILPKVQDVGRELMRASHQAAASHQIFAKQIENNKTWLTTFRKNSQSEIRRFVSNQLSPLRNDIASFADQYAQSNHIEREWKRRVEQHTKPTAAESQIRKWRQSLNRQAETIQKNLEADLSFEDLKTGFTFVNAGRIWDWKKFINWTTGLGAAGIGLSGLGLAALGIAVTGPVGWIIGGAALAVGVLGRLFSGKSQKDRIAERAAEIRSSLNQGISQMSQEYESKLQQVLDNLSNEFDAMVSKALQEQETLLRQNKAAYQGAGQELRELVAANHHLLAANLLNLTANGNNIPKLPSIGRVPGQRSILMTRSNQQLSSDQLKALEHQLDEPVTIISHANSPAEIIRRCLGESQLPVTLDPDGKIATIPQKDLNIDQVNRIQAAEQLADVYIVKDESPES